MDGGPRRPVSVAVPLDQVDLAADNRIVIRQPPGGPAGGQAAELDSGFPCRTDASPPGALNFPAEVGAGNAALIRIAFFCRPDDEIGLAVEEYVFAIVAVLSQILRPVPEHRVLDRLPESRHRPTRRIGSRAASRPIPVINIMRRRSISGKGGRSSLVEGRRDPSTWIHTERTIGHARWVATGGRTGDKVWAYKRRGGVFLVHS